MTAIPEDLKAIYRNACLGAGKKTNPLYCLRIKQLIERIAAQAQELRAIKQKGK